MGKKKGKKERILAAARAIFLRKGYSGATMEDIAREAGVSKGVIYLYFKNKDDLYVSLMLPMIGKLGEMLLDLEKDSANGKFKTGSNILVEFHNMFARLYEYDPEGLRIFQVCLLLDLFRVIDESARERMWLMEKRNLNMSSHILANAMNQGLLPQMNPLQLTYMLWGMFLGIIQLEGSKLRITQKDHVLETVKYCFSIFSNGLRTNPAGIEDGRKEEKNPVSTKIVDRVREFVEQVGPLVSYHTERTDKRKQ